MLWSRTLFLFLRRTSTHLLLSLSLSPSQRLVPLNKLVRFNDSYFFLVTRLPSFAPNAPLEKVAVNLVGSPRSLSLSFSPSLSPRFRPPRITRWYGVNDSWRVPPRFPKTEEGRSRPSTRRGLLSPREFLLSWSSVQLENARDRLLILFWNLLEVIRYATRIRFIVFSTCRLRAAGLCSRSVFRGEYCTVIVDY